MSKLLDKMKDDPLFNERDPRRAKMKMLELMQTLLDRPAAVEDAEARIAVEFIRDSLLTGRMTFHRRRNRGPNDTYLVAELKPGGPQVQNGHMVHHVGHHRAQTRTARHC